MLCWSFLEHFDDDVGKWFVNACSVCAVGAVHEVAWEVCAGWIVVRRRGGGLRRGKRSMGMDRKAYGRFEWSWRMLW